MLTQTCSFDWLFEINMQLFFFFFSASRSVLCTTKNKIKKKPWELRDFKPKQEHLRLTPRPAWSSRWAAALHANCLHWNIDGWERFCWCRRTWGEKIRLMQDTIHEMTSEQKNSRGAWSKKWQRLVTKSFSYFRDPILTLPY